VSNLVLQSIILVVGILSSYNVSDTRERGRERLEREPDTRALHARERKEGLDAWASHVSERRKKIRGKEKGEGNRTGPVLAQIRRTLDRPFEPNNNSAPSLFPFPFFDKPDMWGSRASLSMRLTGGPI